MKFGRKSEDTSQIMEMKEYTSFFFCIQVGNLECYYQQEDWGTVENFPNKG